MHVCYVLPPIEYYSPQTGGALATVTAGHAQELIKRGHRVSVLAPRCENEIYPVGAVTQLDIGTRQTLSIWKRGFSSKVVRSLRGYDWLYSEYYWPTLKTPLQSLQPDVVMVFNDIQTPLEIRRVLPRAKIAVILQNQQRTNARNPQRHVAIADAFIACSNFIRDWTKHHYQLAPEKICTLHNGIDIEQFRPNSDKEETDFLRGCGPLRVAMAGRIDPNKGGDLVAQAVIDLKREGLPIQLVVAGGVWFYGNETQEKDPYFQRLKSLLDAAGAEYLGHIARSEMPAFYRSCDVACVPSRWDEPFGLVALEAMACGLAVVTARRGGLPEFCDGAAMMIDAEQPGSVTKALRELTSNKEKLRELKRAGVVRAAEYSWEVIGERLEKLLASI